MRGVKTIFYMQNSSWGVVRVMVGILCITGIAAVSGCTDAQAADINLVKLTISASVNWDKDPEADGVQFIIRPQDDSGLLIKDKCIINSRVWLQQDEEGKEKGKLIDEWHQFQVTRKDYDEYVGARIRLEYHGYVPLPPENGILWIEVITSDGRSFSFQEANVRLGYYNLPDIKRDIGCCP